MLMSRSRSGFRSGRGLFSGDFLKAFDSGYRKRASGRSVDGEKLLLVSCIEVVARMVSAVSADAFTLSS